MSTQIALLRAVNVGGHRKVAMPALREFLTALGFADARSLVQSGNLVFGSGTAAGLERLLEGEAEVRLGLRTQFFVRTAREWESLIAQNPFPEEARRDPAHLLVMLLKEAPTAAASKALEAAIADPERIRVHGRQAFLTYPDGIAGSRLTNALIEKKLGTRGTARNWNTVLKLAALASAGS